MASNAMVALRDCGVEDKEVLAEIVNTLYKRDIWGTKGPWKRFLTEVVDKNSSRVQFDPFKRPWDVLTTFLDTITDDRDISLVKGLYSFIKQKHEMDSLPVTPVTPVTPEEELVQMTRAHIRYKQDYSFESYSKGWIHIGEGTAEDQSTPENLVALDCEMVDCEGGIHELVRVCLVDRNLTTLIDTLVLPSKRVLDYKSHITGVSAKDLQQITVTQTDVQKQVAEALVPGTIVVGHSLHNDLKALKIDYRRVIDTQFIFQIQGRPPKYLTPLRDICKAVLGYEFREKNKVHNCLEDAKIPMKLVLHRLQNGPSLLEIPHEVDESILSKLLLHQVPLVVTNSDLQSLFPRELSCQIQDTEKQGIFRSTYKSKYAVFRNKVDANNAFAQLQGFLGTDVTGRLQKRVFFHPKKQKKKSPKVELLVRKMGFEDSAAEPATTSTPKVSYLERTSTLSQISESLHAGVRNNSGIEETAEKVEMVKKSRNSKRSRQDDVESLGVEPSRLSVSDDGNGTENGMAEPVENVTTFTKVKKHKSPCVTGTTVTIEPSRLSGCFEDRDGSDDGVGKADGCATDQNPKSVLLRRSRAEGTDDMMFSPMAKKFKVTANEEPVAAIKVKSLKKKKKQIKKKKKRFGK